MLHDVKEPPKRAVLAAVQRPDVSDFEFQSSLAELRQLAKTLGLQVVATFTQKRPTFDHAAYLGTGKRDELRRFVRNEPPPVPASADAPADAAALDDAAALPGPAVDRRDPDKKATSTDELDETQRSQAAELLLLDHEVSPSQARNLEKECGLEVMDRTMVILEIFHRHAHTRAARAQVEIVRLRYMAPRMREASKVRGAGRQRSNVGGRGVGESQMELDRRKIRDRISELEDDLKALDLERATQRARRRARSGIARVALVGYTNAGKSTLMRALTESEVLVEDKLFATLDTTVRTLVPESVPRVLVSDTVGFIKNLPHGLVASFKSTLDEALEASLLLHVVDVSDPGFERQWAVTEEVLAEIGAGSVPRIHVLNKLDKLGPKDAPEVLARLAELSARHPEALFTCAKDPADIARVHATIVDFFRSGLQVAELRVPWKAQALRGEIFAACEVLSERAEDDAAVFEVRAPAEALARLREALGER